MLKERKSTNIIDRRYDQHPYSKPKVKSFKRPGPNPIAKAVGYDGMEKAAARQRYFSKKRISTKMKTLNRPRSRMEP